LYSTVLFAGQPNQPVVLSQAAGPFSDKFNLTWTVDSFSPILAYKIAYRKHMVRTL
jgi:hypothetical protein